MSKFTFFPPPCAFTLCVLYKRYFASSPIDDDNRRRASKASPSIRGRSPRVGLPTNIRFTLNRTLRSRVCCTTWVCTQLASSCEEIFGRRTRIGHTLREVLLDLIGFIDRSGYPCIKRGPFSLIASHGCYLLPSILYTCCLLRKMFDDSCRGNRYFLSKTETICSFLLLLLLLLRRLMVSATQSASLYETEVEQQATITLK